jgi:hypothetical protein
MATEKRHVEVSMENLFFITQAEENRTSCTFFLILLNLVLFTAFVALRCVLRVKPKIVYFYISLSRLIYAARSFHLDERLHFITRVNNNLFQFLSRQETKVRDEKLIRNLLLENGARLQDKSLISLLQHFIKF